MMSQMEWISLLGGSYIIAGIVIAFAMCVFERSDVDENEDAELILITIASWPVLLAALLGFAIKAVALSIARLIVRSGRGVRKATGLEAEGHGAK